MNKGLLIITGIVLLIVLISAVPATQFDYEWLRAEQLFRKGLVQYNGLRFNLAIDYFNRSLEVQSRYYLARIWLGKAYFRAGYLDNALNEWRLVEELGGGNNILHQRINTLLYRLGRPQETRPLYQDYRYLKTIDGVNLEMRFFNPTALNFDMNNHLWVVGFGSHSITGIDANGVRLGTIKGGKRPFKYPFAIAREQSGAVWVSDFGKDRIQKLSSDGKGILFIGSNGSLPGEFHGPEGLAVDDNDNLWVVDSGNNRVQKFSSQGEFLAVFGHLGDGSGELFKPSGIAVGPKGNIYISDTGNHRVQVFDQYGNWRETIGQGRLRAPRALHFIDGNLYIADGDSGLYIYYPDSGTYYNFLHYDNNHRMFKYVSDAALSDDAMLYIADMDASTVEVFVPKQYKYVNLDVDIEYTDTRLFPLITHYVTVRSREGEIMQNLRAENFRVLENDTERTFVQLSSVNRSREKCKVVFCIDESAAMEPYAEDLINATGYFLDAIGDEDAIKVVKCNNNVWTGLDWSWGKNRVQNALIKHNYQSSLQLDRGLYHSVADLIGIHERNAVLLFTAGKFNPVESFSDPVYDVVLNFALNNHVPIYIIAFSRENETILKDLCERTGGEYYYYFASNALKDMRHSILNQPIWHYLVQYSTPFDTRQFRRLWRKVEIQINYNNLIGSDTSGYYFKSVPKR